MPRKSIPNDAVQIYISKEQVNALLTLLEIISSWDINPPNYIVTSAQKLKDKIILHGRQMSGVTGPSVSVFLFQNESVALIKILLICISTSIQNAHDYYPLIGQKRFEPGNDSDTESAPERNE